MDEFVQVTKLSRVMACVGWLQMKVYTVSLTSSGGYGSAVNLRCSGAVPLTCTVSPASLTPTPAGAAFTVTTSNDAENHFNFTIDGTGTDVSHIHKSTPVELIVGFNLAIKNNSPSQSIAAGQSASYNLDVVPLGNGSVFPGDVTLSCAATGLPPLSTCSFTPSLVASGQGDTNVVLKIVTASANLAVVRGAAPHLLWYDLGFSVIGVVFALSSVKKRRDQPRRQYLRLGLLGLFLCFFAGCGTGSSGGANGAGGGGAGHPGTPSGDYSITVNGAVGSVTRSAQVFLTVK